MGRCVLVACCGLAALGSLVFGLVYLGVGRSARRRQELYSLGELGTGRVAHVASKGLREAASVASSGPREACLRRSFNFTPRVLNRSLEYTFTANVMDKESPSGLPSR